jgi:hypothetical protein
MRAEIGALQHAGSWLNESYLPLMGLPSGSGRKAKSSSPPAEQFRIYRRGSESHNCFVAMDVPQKMIHVGRGNYSLALRALQLEQLLISKRLKANKWAWEWGREVCTGRVRCMVTLAPKN